MSAGGNEREGEGNGPDGTPKRDLPERTFQFAIRIVNLSQVLMAKAGVGRVLAAQLLRSGTAVGAMVQEGQAGQSRADFVAKYAIACKEARETQYWLRLLIGTEVIPAARLAPLLQEATELVAILTTIIKKTRANAEDASKPRRPPPPDQMP